MSLASDEKPAASSLGPSTLPHYIVSDVVQVRSQPTVSGDFPRILNPGISAASGAGPLSYQKHALCDTCRQLLQRSRILEPKTQRAAELELGRNLCELLASAA